MQNNASPAGEKILEGNKAIALFYGYKKVDGFFGDEYHHPDGGYNYANGLKFHSSWEALMPVCKRIVEMYFDKREEIFLGLNKCNIEDTWKAVVKFISFWNDDTQEKMIWRGKPVSEQQLKWRNSKINEWYNQQTPTNE